MLAPFADSDRIQMIIFKHGSYNANSQTTAMDFPVSVYLFCDDCNYIFVLSSSSLHRDKYHGCNLRPS